MDYLLTLSKNPGARGIIESLGLPVPMPPVLRRARRPWELRVIDDQQVALASPRGGAVRELLAHTLAPSGARVVWTEEEPPPDAFWAAGRAWAQPVEGRREPAPGQTVRALVFDATGIAHIDQLSKLYDFFHAWLPTLDRGGRVIVVGRPVSGVVTEGGAATVACRAALEGFVRSLSKELGRKGATANLVGVEAGAEERLAGPLRFLLSDYSSFITGQPLQVSALTRKNAAAPEHQPLNGKLALVTGSSRGIGAETAKTLAREGAQLVIVDRPGSETEASQLARSLDATLLLVDITEPEAPANICRELTTRHGGVDIVVHNAGVTRDKTLARMPRDAWEMVLAVNLEAAVRLTEELLAQHALRDEGRLVQLSSVGGIAGNPGQTNYAASKAGLIGYTRGLAPELAARGITVNAVAPGLIETRMTAQMPVGVREAARRLSSLNQGGEPNDVAEAITFLAMPWADGCTGQVLRVCGGALIGA